MDDDDEPDAAPQEVWVPVTIHIPLGAMKAWNPGKCAPLSLFCGPYAIILLAQTANTVLVPVLPFLITDTGSSATAYGLLQSTFWATETVLAPLLGALSDYIGRRAVIALSLLISAAGHALLATAPSLTQMAVARFVAGLGFQIALFKAYFADAAPKKKRTGAFGLIGVIQGLALAAGPSVGGTLSKFGSKRLAAWLASALCGLAAIVCLVWQPDEQAVVEANKRRSLCRQRTMSEMQSSSRSGTPSNGKSSNGGAANGAAVAPDPALVAADSPGADSGAEEGNMKRVQSADKMTVGGVKFVKLDLSGVAGADVNRAEGCATPVLEKGFVGRFCGALRTMYLLAAWLSSQGVYSLLSLNFFYRFAFSAYKTVFALYCAAALGYGAPEVGYVLSCVGLAGIVVQGALVRIVVGALGEERTLVVAMAATAAGFLALSMTTNVWMLCGALSLIAIGYGFACPCLSTLFSNVPVEQGVMQGIAGSIDRFGQALGPIAGGYLLDKVGEAALLRYAAVALVAVSSICMLYIGDGCIAWLRLWSTQRAGYAPVAVADAADDDDDDGPEVPPSPKRGPAEGAPVPEAPVAAVAARGP